MDKRSEVQEWLDFSARDLQAAIVLAGHYPVAREIVCFHCQQSVEKLLKAYLVAIMTISLDRKADAAYIRLAEGTPYESEEVEKGVVLDFDQAGRVIAIELLGASKQLPSASLSSVKIVSFQR